MSNSPEKHPIANDVINLVVAIVPWLLPDSPNSIKIFISVVFFAVIIISRRNPNFITNFWQPLYYVLFVVAPIGIGILSWVIFNPWTTFNAPLPFSGFEANTLILGLGFGSIIGFPLAIIGANTEKKSTNSLSSNIRKSFRGGLSGCLLQVLVIIGIIIFIVTTKSSPVVASWSNEIYTTTRTVDLNFLSSPLGLGVLGGMGPLIYTFMYKFDFIILLGALLINTVFVIIGFMFSKIQKRLPK
jgi:hypothetical protein